MRLPGLRAAWWQCMRVTAGQRSFSSQAAVRAKPRWPSLNVPPSRPAQETKRKKLFAARDEYDYEYADGAEAAEEDEKFFRPSTAKRPYPADRPPPLPSPHNFAASVLTAVMSTPDGEWGGRRLPLGGWDGIGQTALQDRIKPIGIPLPPPPPETNFSKAIGPGVVAPHRPAAPKAPNPYTGLTRAQMQPALRRMAAAKAAEEEEKAAGEKAAEEKVDGTKKADDKGNNSTLPPPPPPPPPPSPSKKKKKNTGRPANAAVTKAEARAAAAEAGPPLRVRYAHEHVMHPFSMRFLDGTAVSMPLPGPSAAPSAASPYGTASYSGFATQYATGPHSPRARPPTLAMSFPHCLRGLMIQRYKAKHATEPLWINIVVHHAFPGPLALPKRSPLVQHCMKRRVKRIFFNALRRRGYDGAGRPLGPEEYAAVSPPPPRPAAPLQGSVSFDGLVPIVLKLPFVQLEAFMDGIVDAIEPILGKTDVGLLPKKPPTRARARAPDSSRGPPEPGSRKTREKGRRRLPQIDENTVERTIEF